MPFRFVYVCDLLESLENIFTHHPPYLPKDAERKSRDVISNWFKTHTIRIKREADGLALLSILLPQRRKDKIYNLKETSLEKIIGRVLAVPSTRLGDLKRWREPGAGDFGDCVQRVFEQTPMAVQARANEVTIEDIERALSVVASNSIFSSPEIRSSALIGAGSSAETLLGPLYLRLQAREAKWLTRLILKTYAPVMLSETLVYKSYHYLLPDLLKIQDNLLASLKLLPEIDRQNSRSDSARKSHKNRDILPYLRPVVGVKVGRQPFYKARSIKHCISMAQNRRMSIEKKYDGEYCQIHINMTAPRTKQITIFSKSGRDSTEDRVKVHRTIRRCLRLDEPNCMITKQCILEGELVVYSDKDHNIMDFHKIRKHVSRSRLFISTERDSQPHAFEHLMVVFFDILALDEKPILCLSHYERVHQLEDVVCRIPGYADFAERHIISFSDEMAAKELRKAFAQCIITRGEGLVVKPTDESYFNFSSRGGYRSCCIKMKKEYIGTFGDVGDFAMVGASYDAVQAKSFGIPNLKWTEFYIGCLENKDAVQRRQATPKFVVVTTVSLNREMMKHLFAHYSGNLFEEPPFEFRIEKGVARGKRPSVIFHEPFVFDIRCFAFDKEGNTGFWTMRFPQVSKIHFDRSYLDTITFYDLQQMAESARADPDIESPQEELDWIKKLEAADSRGVAVDASTLQSNRSMSTDTNTILTRHSSSEVINEEAFASNCEVITKTTIKPGLWLGFPSKTRNTSNSSKKRGTSLQNIEQSIKGGLPKKQKLSITDQILNSDNVLRTQTPRKRSIPGSAVLSEITQKINANAVLPEQASTEGKPRTVDPKEDYQPVGHTTYSRPIPSTGNVHLTSSTPQNYSGSVKENAFPAPSFQQPLVSKVMIQKGLCKWAGISCAFVRCSLMFSPCVASMPLLDDYLVSHGIVLDLRGSNRANALITSGEASDGPKSRKIMLAEMKRPRQTAEALRGMKDFGVSLRSEIGDWIEVYDWRLLECITAIEQGKPATYDPWRHYWIGAT